MGSSPFYEQNDMETTSSQPRGGCFSSVLTPLMVIFLMAMIFQFITGDTTEPWELRITINEFPASAHAEIDPSPVPAVRPIRTILGSRYPQVGRSGRAGS